MVTRVWEKSRRNFVSGCRFPKAEDILHHLQFSIISFQIELSTSTCLWERKIISLFFAPWFTYLNYYNSYSTLVKKVNEGCFARKYRLTLTTDVFQKYPTCNVPSNPISAMFLCSEWTMDMEYFSIFPKLNSGTWSSSLKTRQKGLQNNSGPMLSMLF